MKYEWDRVKGGNEVSKGQRAYLDIATEKSAKLKRLHRSQELPSVQLPRELGWMQHAGSGHRLTRV